MSDKYKEKILDGKLWIYSNKEWKAASYNLILSRMLLAERNLERLIEQYQKLKSTITR